MFEQEVFEVRRRIATLEGQKAQADTELFQLREIPCPVCKGKGQFEEERGDTGVFIINCALCNNSGKASGKNSGY